MLSKKVVTHFLVLLFPMFVLSGGGYFVYSLQARQDVQMNWVVIVAVAVLLDVFFVRFQRRDRIADNADIPPSKPTPPTAKR